MSTFAMLSRAKSLGFNFTAVLVQAFLDERGFAPIGVIADACGVSPRSVERAIAQLRSHGLVNSKKKPSGLTHDHADHSFREVGAPTAVAAVPAIAAAQADRPVAPAFQGPLADKLLAHGILPWCVEQLVAKVDPAVLERQLAYHEHRLARGFGFKSHPARYLFRACLNDYLAPEGFGAPPATVAPARPPVTCPANRPAAVVAPQAAQRVVAQAEPAPQAAAPAPMSRAGALSAIRLGLRSKLPFMRAEALRLAAEWGVDPASLEREAV